MRNVKSQRRLSWFPYLASALLAALAAANGVAAQNALVLSGGGARGLAHVGVVFELEQRGYDADLVIGNSMGAVVGALYAAGYEPDEIRQRVQSVRWSELFDPTPIVLGPDRELRVPAFNVDLDIARLRFSRGLLGSWRVNRTLARLLFDANARSRGDFDRLARRYRAIATDLQTGDEVVLDGGDLARAVRASMAYPGFFAPVLWGERVLIDGGIVDNFPVGVARALGAAHVIGVDVSRPTPEIESQAPFAVIQRAVNLMQRNPRRDSTAVDALVLPETYSASVGPGFPDDVNPLIELGRTAAQRDLPAVLPSALPGRRTLPSAPVSFSTLELEAADSALAALARRVFTDVIGKPYDPELVLAATDRLFATGLFEGVWPRAASSADTTGRPALLVRLDAPPTVSLSLAAQYDNDRSGRGWATLDKYGRISRLPVTYSAAVSVGGLD
ncbi:MAG TPA: patatin-like phospholipase family protein, partial [Longimicrobiales bacterium]|nr:patatin-like phospholipase family protein [Longimicrobiales bacterium]